MDAFSFKLTRYLLRKAHLGCFILDSISVPLLPTTFLQSPGGTIRIHVGCFKSVVFKMWHFTGGRGMGSQYHEYHLGNLLGKQTLVMRKKLVIINKGGLPTAFCMSFILHKVVV